ncbi:uncharacterized protein LOC143891664 [Tasmannia lanceolata]|uniref:uncharacterized protein LOC143891664 n=1 Tax=Tasmannia lanceolata TaxID=3420 RepID=UPI004063C917
MSPDLNRPTVSPLEIDLDDEQYAEEYCALKVNKEKEMYEKFEREMSEKLGKLAQEMEHMKVQGPKKFDVLELMLSSAVALPPNFKVPDYDKYDGTGCPRSHMRWFIILSQQYGLSREQMAQLFPISLVGIAKKWFLRLKPDEVRTMEDISDKLIEQFLMEEGIEVTKRDLKQLKQGPQETFTSFIRRWRRKSAQLNQRLSKKDQIKLVVKSLSTQYFHFMAPQHYPNFDHLIQTGTQTEDSIGKGLRARPSPSDVREGKRPIVIQKEVNNVNYVRPVARTVTQVSKPVEKQAPKQFDPLPYPYPVIPKKLIRDKKIKLPDIRPPLPNHRDVPPPVTNAIFVDEPILDPSTLICSITSDKPYVLRLDDEEIKELTKEKPYVLFLTDGDFVESSCRPYVLYCKDVEEEQMNKAPYVLKIEDDDLLFLDDQCDELQHVTRGGRVFKPPELSAENPIEIARAAENQRQNKLVTEEEDDNLLKQLKKTQENISIWGLLMSSSKHRKVILRELNAAQVSVDVTPDELVSMVAMARASRALFFTDEDLPPEGRDHTKSLKITIICNKKKVPEVLVGNGSALNVCPLSTTTTLGFRPENFVPSEQGILAYDGTHRDVIGTLVTEIQIGGEKFEIEFQVLNIKASILLLLSRPWLHRVGVISSTLHQKLKFIRNNRVITVKGDPDLEIGQISQELIVGKAGDISLIGFLLEVTAITMEEAMNEEVFFLSSTNSKVIKMIRQQGYIPGAGLGKYHQGMTESPVFKTFNGLFGLGCKPTKKEIIEMKRYMLKWAECRHRGLDLPIGPLDLTMNGRFRKEGADVPFCGIVEVESILGVGDVSSASEVESEDISTDVLDVSHVHISECVDTNVNMSVSKFVNTIPESVKLVVGYPITDVIIDSDEIKDSFAYIPISISTTESASEPNKIINNNNQDSPSDEGADETPLEIKHMIQHEESC